MNPIGAVVTMGVLFWIAYAMVAAFLISTVGVLIIIIAGIGGLIYYIITIGQCIKNKNAKGAWLLLLAPALMAGVSLLCTAIWYYGGPSFLTSVVGEYVPDPDEAPAAYIILFPLGLFVCFGWIIPLMYAHGYARSSRQVWYGSSFGDFIDGMFLTHPRRICIVAAVWGVLGGSTWATSVLWDSPPW